MTDNQLLEKFFQEARQTEIPDNGFTQRVMQHVPDRKTQRLSRLWTTFCIVVAAVLFVLLRGWEIIAYGLLMLVNTPLTQQQLVMIAASAGVLGLLAFVEFVARERYSVL
jgi:uncharacterized membrane protein YcjF (UPF0283 family)